MDLSRGSWSANFCLVHLCFEFLGTNRNIGSCHFIGSISYKDVRIWEHLFFLKHCDIYCTLIDVIL